MNIKQINDKISYVEATCDPLSADIGMIKSKSGIWLYDVGNDKNSVLSLTGKYRVVLSHFHLDHIGNLARLQVEDLYVSKYTCSHIGNGTIVEKDLYIDDLHIFLLPSCHTKGALGLEIDETYAFIGDAIYSKSNAEHYIYNAQLLKEEIEVLKKLKARYLLVSHFDGMIREKAEVIRELEAIYAERDSASSEILVKKA